MFSRLNKTRLPALGPHDLGGEPVSSPVASPASDDPSGWPTGRLLSTAARLVEHAWDAHLAAWDLNHASFAVLWHLDAGPLSQRELAVRVQVQDQTMSRVLERLERSGYVRRERATRDRRRVLVHVTDAGRLARDAAGDPALAERMVTAAVPADEVPGLRRHLVAIVERLAAERWG
jgi:DNA-binding MarR family transcriptional regulator